MDVIFAAAEAFRICSTICPTNIGNSNGHGCMLQYALLHLAGYKLSLDDLKAFRVSLDALYHFNFPS